MVDVADATTLPADLAGRVAIVQDHLVQQSGGERGLLSMRKALPGAAVYTSFYVPEAVYPEFRAMEIITSPLNRVGPLRRHHRAALPLLAPAFSAMRVDADVVVCGTSGWAQGVRTEGRKVLYFYAPSRWLYERDAYVRNRGAAARVAITALAPALKWWDRRTVASAVRFVTEGTAMRALLRDLYGVDADIVPLPATLDPADPRVPADGIEPGFWLCPTRLVPYKNIDILLRAFADLPDERLVICGDGSERGALAALAPPNVALLPTAPDGLLRWLYANCDGVISAAFEPFGLTPVEGARFGKPTVALAAGGFLDTVIPDVTGVRFATAEPLAVVGAVRAFRQRSFDPATIVAHSEEYSEDRYIARIRAIVAEELAAG